MSYKGHASAISNELAIPLLAGRFDLSPDLTSEEQQALSEIAQRMMKPHGFPCKRERVAVSRLVAPINFVLEWIGTCPAMHFTAKRLMLLEMNRFGKPCWAWPQEACLEVACGSPSAFLERYGKQSSVRQQVLALMCALSGFSRLTVIGSFHRFHLASKVFGRTVIESLTSEVYAEMRKIGYTQPPYGLAQALHTAFLMERDPRLEAISGETLMEIADTGPILLRRGAARLSRVLSRMGLLDGTIDNYAVARAARRERETEYRATDDVPGEWANWATRWRLTAAGSDSSREKLYFGVLKFARWLAKKHPGAAGPGQVTRDMLIEYVAAVDRMKVGEWSNPIGNAARTIGKPLTAASKAALLNMIQRFFADLQEWEWIEKRFDPHRILAVPKPIASLIGPSPRVVADDIWAKIVWAGLNLSKEDSLPRRKGSPPRKSSFYPIELVRAAAHLWLFAGLRSDEIHRLGVGCIRWQSEAADPGSPLCLLDVPTCKTATAFTKPVDALVGRAVSIWETARHPHPLMLDAKTGRMVDFLFVHRGRRVAKHYINETLIPLICAKAGVPREDARGPITCHRARATIATQLYNAKEPLSLFELKEWLGHADVRATQHYAALTPTKLTSAFRRAGYLERNLRSISVLLDGKAVREGLASLGEPWRYYDLGHGFCCYDFFDQCPHRMACVKCSFYGPKESARIQALEANGNLSRMLQEIPLREEERAAIEDGAEAMAKLASGLRNMAAPDGRTPGEIAAFAKAAGAAAI